MIFRIKIIYFILLFFVLGDLTHSFIQHLNTPIDGDLAWNIADTETIDQILSDPLALKATIQHKQYLNPNRFFCHWSMKLYINQVPKFFKLFTTPLESVYLSIATAKLIIEGLLIFIISYLVTRKVFSLNFAIMLCLTTVLFQTNGYNGYMGVILSSITYTFFLHSTSFIPNPLFSSDLNRFKYQFYWS